MRAICIYLATIVMTTSSAYAVEPQPAVDYLQLAAYPAGPYNPEKWEQRNKMIRSILDPSEGRASATAKLAAGYAQLDPEGVRTILELTPWLADLSKRLKATTRYAQAEKLARRCLSADESICLRFSLKNDGKIVERIGPRYNLPPIDNSPTRRKLREIARELINSAAPFSDPPNAFPVGQTMLFEFYLSSDNHLEVTVSSQWG